MNSCHSQHCNHVPQHCRYDASSDLDEAVCAKVSTRVVWPADGHHAANISYTQLASILTANVPRVMIANVLHGRHFVLVVGVDSVSNDTLWVRDSGFNRATYSLQQDVLSWRIFDVAPDTLLGMQVDHVR
jgi:hypothetical protein